MLNFRLKDIIPMEDLESMGRRRYQKPNVFKSRGKRPEWFFRARMDVLTERLQPGQKPPRREKPFYVGYVDEIGKREAEKRRDEILSEVVNKPQTLIPSQVKFREVIDAYRRDHLPLLRETTQRTQAQALATYFDSRCPAECKRNVECKICGGSNENPYRALGNLRMCDIDALEIQQWLSRMNLAYSTKRQYLGLLRTIWTKAEEWGFVQRSFPKAKYNLGVKRDVKGREMPNVDQLRRFLAALEDPYRAMAEVALYTGLRISEIRGLQWGDIENGRVTIRRRISQQNVVDVPKSAAGFRVFDARPLAGVLARTARKDDWIFGGFGTSYDTCRDAVEKARIAAGIKVARFSWHHLRAICNTMLSHGGANATDRLALLGHTTEAMNAAYILQADDDVRRRGDLMLSVQSTIMGHTKGVQ